MDLSYKTESDLSLFANSTLSYYYLELILFVVTFLYIFLDSLTSFSSVKMGFTNDNTKMVIVKVAREPVYKLLNIAYIIFLYLCIILKVKISFKL
jgi:hypothetical protein